MPEPPRATILLRPGLGAWRCGGRQASHNICYAPAPAHGTRCRRTPVGGHSGRDITERCATPAPARVIPAPTRCRSPDLPAPAASLTPPRRAWCAELYAGLRLPGPSTNDRPAVSSGRAKWFPRARGRRGGNCVKWSLAYALPGLSLPELPIRPRTIPMSPSVRLTFD